MTPLPTCPSCRAALPADAPEGMCPECLFRAGFETGGRRAEGAPVPGPDELAAKLPQFEVLGVLGRGGMGVVWRARQKSLDREVALKVLAPDVAAAAGFAERFRREAKALARLDHPNIVRVHDSGEAGGVFWIAMELVEGTNLRQAIAARAIRPHETLAIVRQVCDALEYAHSQGVVHRDIKPENVLISKDGRVKVADFGIAKIAGTTPDDSLTAVGQVVGTAHYMAPEQIEHPATVDHRADIYSLGVVFYELLTGELPLGRFAPPSAKVQIDVRLDEIVLRTLSKERETRYQRAVEVRTSVDALGAGPAQEAPAAGAPHWTRSWAAAGGAAAFTAASWGLGLSTRNDAFVVPIVAGLVGVVWIGGRARLQGPPWSDRSRANRWSWILAGAVVVVAAFNFVTPYRHPKEIFFPPLATAGAVLALFASTWSAACVADAARPRRSPLAVRGIGFLAVSMLLGLAGVAAGDPSQIRGLPLAAVLLAMPAMAAGWIACLVAIIGIVRAKGAWTGLGLAVAGVAIPVVLPVAATTIARIVQQ